MPEGSEGGTRGPRRQPYLGDTVPLVARVRRRIKEAIAGEAARRGVSMATIVTEIAEDWLRRRAEQAEGPQA